MNKAGSDAHAPILRLVPSLGARIAPLVWPLLIELVGLAGVGLATWGVYLNWGKGWALIAAGLPLLVVYVIHAIRWAQSRPRG